MTPNKWQLKAAVTGTVPTSSDWDGKSLGEIYLTLRRQGDTYRTALDTVEAIKANRLWAMDGSQISHVSQDQALVWLLEAHVGSYEALSRVYGANVPQWAQKAVEAVWSKRNAEHRQALEDARMAGMNELRRPILAEQIQIDELVRQAVHAPHKLTRILANQTRANACAGGCGRPVWGEHTLCRKCERKQRRGK